MILTDHGLQYNTAHALYMLNH